MEKETKREIESKSEIEKEIEKRKDIEKKEEPRIPSWLWYIVLNCTTDNIGEKGTHTALRRSNLDQFIATPPEDDDSPSVTVNEFSHYVWTLFDIFGEVGARPILLRSGRIGFTAAYDRMPPLIKLASKMLKVLPEKRRVATVVSEFNKAFNEVMGVHGFVIQNEGSVVVIIPECPYCRGIVTEKPACYVEIGLLLQLVETAVGSGYTVQETKCMAKGDHVCQFEVRKVNSNQDD